MAEGFAEARANAIIDAWDGLFVQLHTAAPGAAGTANVAGNATRKAISLATASGGTAATDAELAWSDAEVDTTEDYTHATIWTLVTGGVFEVSGLITANAVDATGDSFTIAIGGLSFTIPIAS